MTNRWSRSKLCIGISLICALICTLICTLAPSTSHAGYNGCYGHGTLAVRPRWPVESGLVQVRETIHLDCEAPRGGERRCTWSSVHVFEREDGFEHAPPSTAIYYPGLMEVEDLSVRVNGRLIEVEISETGSVSIPDDGLANSVDIEIHHTGQWRRSAAPSISQWTSDGCYPWAVRYRHPIIADRRVKWSMKLLHPGELIQLDEAPIDYGTRQEEDFGVHVRGPLARAGVVMPFVARLSARGSKGFHGFLRSHSGAEVQLFRPSFPGGVFVGLGGALLDVDYPLRGRLGFEAAAPNRPRHVVLHSLALETDFRQSLTAIVAIELTHGVLRSLWAPKAGIGTGVPLQLLGEVRPGLRLLASLSWPFIGLLATLDGYPAFRPGQSSTMQLGLLTELRF